MFTHWRIFSNFRVFKFCQSDIVLSELLPNAIGGGVCVGLSVGFLVYHWKPRFWHESFGLSTFQVCTRLNFQELRLTSGFSKTHETLYISIIALCSEWVMDLHLHFSICHLFCMLLLIKPWINRTSNYVVVTSSNGIVRQKLQNIPSCIFTRRVHSKYLYLVGFSYWAANCTCIRPFFLALL